MASAFAAQRHPARNCHDRRQSAQFHPQDSHRASPACTAGSHRSRNRIFLFQRPHFEFHGGDRSGSDRSVAQSVPLWMMPLVTSGVLLAAAVGFSRLRRRPGAPQATRDRYRQRFCSRGGIRSLGRTGIGSSRQHFQSPVHSYESSLRGGLNAVTTKGDSCCRTR